MKWETAKTTDIGLELGFFDNALTFQVEYFYKKNVDLLAQIDLNLSSGQVFEINSSREKPYVNTASVENKGWEFMLGYRKQLTRDFSIDASFNVSTLSNKVLALGDNVQPITSGAMSSYFNDSPSITKPGYPIGSFYGYKIDGFDADGNFIFKDTDKNGIVNADDKVILGLSGGVDSSVAAVLLNKAIGNNLTCIFVDHGMLRKNEFHDVMEDYKCLGLNVIGVDASAKFFADLAGVTDPEEKRKIIGRDFVEVFNAEAKKQTGAKWLAQGTIYPDRIESLNITGKVIKSHHNVGGLPKEMNLQLCEPLQWLFKDEVRRVGRSMGMPEHLITRHPFPGPGLAVRILGDITPEKVRILQNADDIFIRGLREYKQKLSGEDARRVLAAGVPADMQNGEIEVSLYDQIWQAGTVLLSTVRSVGVMGDERTYEHPVALRAVTSTDAMTADWAHLPYDFMAKVSNEIINKVKGVNRVCYDISSKPPSTIEWE